MTLKLTSSTPVPVGVIDNNEGGLDLFLSMDIRYVRVRQALFRKGVVYESFNSGGQSVSEPVFIPQHLYEKIDDKILPGTYPVYYVVKDENHKVKYSYNPANLRVME